MATLCSKQVSYKGKFVFVKRFLSYHHFNVQKTLDLKSEELQQLRLRQGTLLYENLIHPKLCLMIKALSWTNKEENRSVIN